MNKCNDCASVNLASFNILSPFFRRAINIGCFSHTLANAGDQIKTPSLKSFLQHFNCMISRSASARLKFFAIVKEQAKQTSQTRWYCEFEICHQLFTNWPTVGQFLHACVQDGVCVASASPALHTHDHDINLRIEIASVVDGFLPIVQACHVLEGDGFLAPITYDKLLELKAHIDNVQWLNVCRLAALFAPSDVAKQNTLLQHAKQCINPGFAYFKDRFFEFHTRGDLKEAVDFFKSARLLNPTRFCAVYNAQ